MVAMDRMHDGLFLYFADGSSGFYSDTLLYEMLQQAVPISTLIADLPASAEGGPDVRRG